MSRPQAAVPAASPASCKMDNSATTLSLTTRPRLPSRTGSAAATKTSPSQKKKDRQPSAGASRALAVNLQIELIAVGDPAIATLPLFNIADPGEWHVEAGHKNPVRGEHVQDALAGRYGFFLVIIHFEVPFRTLNCHDILRASVRGDHHAFPRAFDVKRHQAGRMACRVDGGDARDNL